MTDANHFRIGRVYESRSDADGHRVLVDRLWPRGVAKASAPWDEWLKTVAPSNDLRSWYGHDSRRYDEFSRRYAAELDDQGHREAFDRLRELGKQGTVTLLTATKDIDSSHVPTLAHKLADED